MCSLTEVYESVALPSQGTLWWLICLAFFFQVHKPRLKLEATANIPSQRLHWLSSPEAESVWDCVAHGRNVPTAEMSPPKDGVLRYIQTCHLWDSPVEMSLVGVIRELCSSLKKTPSTLVLSLPLSHPIRLPSLFLFIQLVETLDFSLFLKVFIWDAVFPSHSHWWEINERFPVGKKEHCNWTPELV